MEKAVCPTGRGPKPLWPALPTTPMAANLDMTDSCDDLLGGSVPSSDPDASFEEVLPKGMPVPFDFAFAFV